MVPYAAPVAETNQHTGRPRESRVDHAIGKAVHELLAEVRYSALTMDAVAARAQVGKAAIYRRHASKAEMVFAVTVHDLDLRAPEDTGSLRDDVAAALADILERLSAPAVMAAAPLFIAELADNKKLAAHFRETLMATELACVTDILDRAVARRELTERPDPAHVHSLMLGSVFAWLFMLRREPARDLADALADLVVHGLSARRGRA